MLTTVAFVCECVGAGVLASLLGWIAMVAFTKLRTPRLLDRLSSRAVFITGCDTGFGHALARRLDGLRVPVVAGCLFPEGSGARSLAKDCSSKLRVLPLDVTSDQQVADAVKSVQAMLKDDPDTVVGGGKQRRNLRLGEVDILPLEKFRQVLEVNTVGPIRVTKAFLPLLKKSKGRVVNVCSPAGRLPVVLMSAYCLAKSALIMFSDVLRLEMKKSSVTVSSIEPSLYGTPIADVGSVKAKYCENIGKTLPNDQDGLVQEVVQKRESLLRFAKSFVKNDISEVIDEMVIACVGRDQQRRHIPGFKETILYTIASAVPDWLRDFMLHSAERIIKIIWS